MKLRQVMLAKSTQHGTYPVRIFDAEGLVLHQSANLRGIAKQRTGRLHTKPLVHYQRLIGKLPGKGRQCLLCRLTRTTVDQARQGRQTFSHVVSLLELCNTGSQHRRREVISRWPDSPYVTLPGLLQTRPWRRLLQQHQITERHVLQPATPDLPGLGRSEEHTSELQSRPHLVCRLLLEK